MKKMKILIAVMMMAVLCCSCGEKDKDNVSSKETEDKVTTTISTDEKETNDESTIDSESAAESESTLDGETTLDSESTSENETTSATEVADKTEATTTKKPDKNDTTQQTTTSGGNNGGSSGNQSQNTEDELTTLVNSVLAKCVKSSMSQLEKVIAIHDYLTYNVDYDYDNYLAGNIPWDSYSALGTLKYGKAVCSGYAEAFYALADAAGLEVIYISGSADNGSGAGYQGHAWNQVKIDGTWYNVDVTWDDPTFVGKDPNDNSYNCYSYCLISDTTMEKDHKPDSYNKMSCAKDYDVAALAKAIASVNTSKKNIYASSETELRTKIPDLVNTGCEEFVVYMTGMDDSRWELFEEILAGTKKPLSVRQMNTDQRGIIRYQIGIEDNAYAITSLSDIKGILDKNKNTYEEIAFWYFNDSIDEWTIQLQINAAIAKAGYSAEVLYYSDPEYGKICFYIQKNEDIVIIDDMTELSSFVAKHTIDEIESTTFMYTGAQMSSDVLGKAIYDVIAPNGYISYWIIDQYTDGITKINIIDMREAIYVENAEQIIEYINKNGASATTGKLFVIYYGVDNCYEQLRNMSMEVSSQTGYNVHDSITYNPCYGYVIFSYDNIVENG